MIPRHIEQQKFSAAVDTYATTRTAAMHANVSGEFPVLLEQFITVSSSWRVIIFVTCSNCRRRNIICGGEHPPDANSDQYVAEWPSLFGGLDSGLDCGTGLWDWTHRKLRSGDWNNTGNVQLPTYRGCEFLVATQLSNQLKNTIPPARMVGEVMSGNAHT